ncbi:MAG TPA: GTPase ObgE [Candidatus Paceibacterota bacterium]|nr:GTPase ObgE [Candidatus Paceibacterota bacterium]
MAFVDEMNAKATAGTGGNGVVRWLHLKGLEKAGPAGGDGGRGGDVVLEGVRDLSMLASYRFTKSFRAQDGGAGAGNDRHGKDGEPAVIKVPVGTVATVEETGETFELLEDGQRLVVFKGGAGGFGNAHFKSSVNRNPFESTPGRKGQEGTLHITLKLIADAGFVGFPNAGKSSLLNALTKSRSRVAAYPFTTLDPHLGDFYGYLLADIPGLIEGASDGRGLGSKFLRHVERTGFLVHLVSAEQEDLEKSYRAIRAELEAAGSGLTEKRELVVLSKIDMLPPEEQAGAVSSLAKAIGKEVIPLSVIDDDLLKAFSDRLAKELAEK